MHFEEGNSNDTANLEEPPVEVEEQEEALVHSIAITPEIFSDSLKLLQQHGITLQNETDDNSILNTVMESGHSVVLTGRHFFYNNDNISNNGCSKILLIQSAIIFKSYFLLKSPAPPFIHYYTEVK